MKNAYFPIRKIVIALFLYFIFITWKKPLNDISMHLLGSFSLHIIPVCLPCSCGCSRFCWRKLKLNKRLSKSVCREKCLSYDVSRVFSLRLNCLFCSQAPPQLDLIGIKSVIFLPSFSFYGFYAAANIPPLDINILVAFAVIPLSFLIYLCSSILSFHLILLIPSLSACSVLNDTPEQRHDQLENETSNLRLALLTTYTRTEQISAQFQICLR